MMMKQFLKLLIVILPAIHIISCTERIEIELDESSVRLVVDGSVTTDTMAHRISLTKTTNYYYDQKPPAVSGASVVIMAGVTEIQLREEEPGVYLTDSNFFGVEGETYMLNISLESPVGGHTFYSASSVMSRNVILDSVSLVYQPEWSEDGFWEVRCFFQDPQTTEYFRFLVYRNGKMLTDTLDEWFVSDDRFFNGDYFDGATIAFFDQGSETDRLESGDEITVELNSVSSDYAGFIREAQSEIWGSNPLFSGPPANVKGNISNGAIGFFTTYTTSRARAKVF